MQWRAGSAGGYGGGACAPFMAVCVPRRGHARHECCRRDGEEEEVECARGECESVIPGVADVWSSLYKAVCKKQESKSADRTRPHAVWVPARAGVWRERGAAIGIAGPLALHIGASPSDLRQLCERRTIMFSSTAVTAFTRRRSRRMHFHFRAVHTHTTTAAVCYT